MDRYLVEAHTSFRSETDFAEVRRRLENHDDVLKDPAPQVIPPDAEGHAIVQFTVEAGSQVSADSTGNDVLEDVLAGSDRGEPLAEVGLVSARSVEGHPASDDAPLAADGRSEPGAPTQPAT
jgi:hypothetical protein